MPPTHCVKGYEIGFGEVATLQRLNLANLAGSLVNDLNSGNGIKLRVDLCKIIKDSSGVPVLDELRLLLGILVLVGDERCKCDQLKNLAKLEIDGLDIRHLVARGKLPTKKAVDHVRSSLDLLHAVTVFCYVRFHTRGLILLLGQKHAKLRSSQHSKEDALSVFSKSYHALERVHVITKC